MCVAVGGPVMLPKADLARRCFGSFPGKASVARRGNTLLGNSPHLPTFVRGDFSSLLNQASPLLNLLFCEYPLLTNA
jgi:hypothetical protein